MVAWGDASLYPPRHLRPESTAGRRIRVALLAILALSACQRDPLESICPSVSPGGLVVTEIRGLQGGADTFGQWLEIHNPGGSAVRLAGLRVLLRRLDGGSEATILVRDHELSIAAGAYAVLGRHPAADLPAHVQYGFAGDFDSDLYSDAVVELRACDALVDRIVYRGLPDQGTLSFGGAAPTAESNDEEAAWCTDGEPPGPGADPTQIGLPGTPGQENRACQ